MRYRSREHKRVLIVEHDPAVASTLALELGALGYDVAETSRSTDALVLIERHVIDVAIIDDELSGIGVVAERLSARRIPFIVVTGKQNVIRGAVHTLWRPVLFGGVLAAVDDAVRR